MDNLVLTILFSLILMLLVVVGLGIGLILTGKSRLTKGCGLTPGKKKKDDSQCPLCEDRHNCKKEKENDVRPPK